MCKFLFIYQTSFVVCQGRIHMKFKNQAVNTYAKLMYHFHVFKSEPDHNIAVIALKLSLLSPHLSLKMNAWILPEWYQLLNTTRLKKKPHPILS